MAALRLAPALCIATKGTPELSCKDVVRSKSRALVQVQGVKQFSTPCLTTPSSRRLSVSAIAHPAAGGRQNWNLDAPDNTVDLCIFPMWTMPLPTASGSVEVMEPHLVALLQVVQKVADASLGTVPARFGALPYDWVQRQMWLEDKVVPPSLSYLGDVPLPAFGDLSTLDRDVVGVSCDIDGIVEEPEGDGFLARYSAKRRFRPLQVLRRKPFLVVRGEWLDDDKNKASSSADGRSTEDLEQEVWREVQDVVRYTAKLQGKPEVRCCGGPNAALPDTVCQLSPVTAPRPTTAEERVKAWLKNPRPRMPSEVGVWYKMKSATAVAPKKAPVETESIPKDPYLAASEKIAKSARQESFSFAAANLVELGPTQRQELLSMNSTAERLHWLLQAIEPHLASLRVECSMRQAMGAM